MYKSKIDTDTKICYKINRLNPSSSQGVCNMKDTVKDVMKVWFGLTIIFAVVSGAYTFSSPIGRKADVLFQEAFLWATLGLLILAVLVRLYERPRNCHRRIAQVLTILSVVAAFLALAIAWIEDSHITGPGFKYPGLAWAMVTVVSTASLAAAAVTNEKYGGHLVFLPIASLNAGFLLTISFLLRFA